MSLSEIFRRHGTDKQSTVHNYAPVYERHFYGFRKKKITMLEIGVMDGASIRSWLEYFEKATVHGIDILESCRQYQTPRSPIHIGDQADEKFLKSVVDQTGPLDVIIDDGGHRMHQQQKSFLFLFPYVKPGGTYIIEDLGACYHEVYDGGNPGSPGTTVEFISKLIDELNWIRHKWRRKTPPIKEIHFYPEIAFIIRGEDDPKSSPPRWS